MSEVYDPARLAPAVAAASNWTDLMRRLGLKESGGRHRVLKGKVAELGLDTSHFKQRSPWRKYPDAAIAAAARSSSSLREVVLKLGATPATGTLSHIARRIAAAGIDVSHFPGMNRPQLGLLFSTEELQAAADSSESVRGVARALGVPDDGRSRAAVAAMLRSRGVDTPHFRNARLSIPEDALRTAVREATSFADVMRALSLEVTDPNHRRVRRKVLQMQLDTAHFKRRTWGSLQAPPEQRRIAPNALVIMPQGSARVNRTRLHRALQEIGVEYQCTSCGSTGEWLGRPITLQIDHVNGNWLDNRAENLRYLCPNCHALTDTWCRNRRRTRTSTPPVPTGPRSRL
ncbi:MULTISPECIES: HNH endonuclease signature motif containing protein [Streptomyces]|uniref:HNH endonuclease signature motif containing protein n=2 Tax=Streptomyces TaxID=1883 RepID=UPI0029B760F6|nr:HNH endonuclease signature motif containing protein [Streptomyces sp. ND04-05B]MDX3064483.1 HNH endonuclease signature motif containing protein [Streptomyces sp. ND04-05B]